MTSMRYRLLALKEVYVNMGQIEMDTLLPLASPFGGQPGKYGKAAYGSYLTFPVSIIIFLVALTAQRCR
jgi:hypothetical protein